MKGHWSSTLVAAAGGISPTIFAVAVALVSERRVIGDYDVSVLIGILIFGLLGGIIGYSWRERDLRKAFQLGISLPAMFQVGISSVSSPQKAGLLELDLARPVYAQSLEVRYRRERSVQLLEGPKNQISGFEVIFQSPNGGRVRQKVPVGTPVPVPDDATTLRVAIGKVESPQQSLSRRTGDTTLFAVEAERSSWYGFFYSVGVRSMEPYEIDVQRIGTTRDFLDSVKEGDLENVRYLLERGVSPKVRQRWSERQPALVVAANNGQAEVARLLLEAGADVNEVDKDNETALIDAAKHGHADVVAVLLEYNPDPNVRDNNKETAFEKAQKSRHIEVIKKLKAAGIHQ